MAFDIDSESIRKCEEPGLITPKRAEGNLAAAEKKGTSVAKVNKVLSDCKTARYTLARGQRQLV
jgi:hypothetical protein